MAKFNEDSAWTALTAPVDTDWLLVCDASADVVKIMDISYLLVALDGDHLDIDFTPTYYTPATTPAEADDVDDLAAHLYGIDQKLGEIDNLAIEQADTTFTVSSTGHYIEIDTSGGGVIATLPSAATLGAGWEYTLKITDATALTTVSTSGAETIDGTAGWVLAYKNELLKIISDGTNWKVLRWDLPIEFERGVFTYVDATSYSVGSACYKLPTSAFGKVYWKGTLTLGPDTWAAGSTSIATTGWHYLYLDQSAIDAGSTPKILDSHFLSSTTAPTYNTTYHAYYNGNDRCIFAVRFSAASTLAKFYHDGGDYVQFDSEYNVRTLAGSVATDFSTTDTLLRPSFSTKAQVTFQCHAAGDVGAEAFYYREGGSSGNGHLIGSIESGASYITDTVNAMIVYCNTSGVIDVRATTNEANTQLGIDQNGWYLPKGM